MRIVAPHPIPVVAALAAAAVLAGVFGIAHALYAPEPDRTLDLAVQEHVSPAEIRTVFAAAGIRLPYAYAFSHGQVLSDVPPARHGRSKPVLVTVGGGTGRVDFGPVLTRYDVRFENVLVTYDGGDRALERRLDAAVASLRR